MSPNISQEIAVLFANKREITIQAMQAIDY
jgi:hypothetical protein